MMETGEVSNPAGIKGPNTQLLKLSTKKWMLKMENWWNKIILKQERKKNLNKTFSEICVTTLCPLVYIVYLHYALSGSP